MVCATGLNWARGGWQQVLQVSRERDQPTASDHQQLWGQGPPWQQPWHCSKLIKNVKSFACPFFKYVTTCVCFCMTCVGVWFVWEKATTVTLVKCETLCLSASTRPHCQQLNKCEILWLLYFVYRLFSPVCISTHKFFSKKKFSNVWTPVSDNTASAVHFTLGSLGL